ncbi:MAG: transcription elongation factor GreA [Bacteroidales bacterium]|jgi:transcription elongation factor GreA|nr:transcription elongation factor GreA [Bacteroidales bacterium]
MAKVSYVTEEGLSRMKKELERLITIERPAISKQIAEARDKGDLSENAEYDAAKDAQGMLEARIHKLEETVRNSRVLDESRVDISSVQILNKVKLKNLKNNMIVEYVLVSESEANLKEGKIAITTPIGKGLVGKKVGNIVDIEVPAGKIQLEILEISR